jgi:homoserine kinase
MEGAGDNIAACLFGGMTAVLTLEESVMVTPIKVARGLHAVAIVPKLKVRTLDARKVLPTTYQQHHVVYNLQRLATLVASIGQEPLDPAVLWEATKDKIHQPYRYHLVPGMQQVLDEIHPDVYPVVLGTFLSGAGSTILVLATEGFEFIARAARDIFTQHNVECDTMWLRVGVEGATCKVTEVEDEE